MTGRGDGYCALVLPSKEGQVVHGYAGAQGMPVRLLARFRQPLIALERALWHGSASRYQPARRK